ncbi:MAG: DUF445 domain-containing protein [Ignavibacterium sp.]|nr:DUF445 domain-containing protein [Ignavibacterium sp.]MDW8375937.1 DUF445 domain-containing protein [Ignavibacteriales bacterium]
MRINKNKIGHISLISVSVGLAITQIGIHTGLLQGPFWDVLSAGFLAGTVGGLADWFAVSALFREIPIPIVKRHTNIIIKNRVKLTEGVVDLVTNKWLSPETIREKLSEVKFAETLITFFKQPQNQERIFNLLDYILKQIVENLDNPQLAKFLQKILKDQLSEFDITKLLGNWLESAVKTGDHNKILDMFLNAVRQALSDPEIYDFLSVELEKALNRYANKHWFRQLVISAGEITDIINVDDATDILIKKAKSIIKNIQENPDHPVRQAFDDFVLDLSNKFKSNDIKIQKIIKGLKNRLLQSVEEQEIIKDILSKFKATVVKELNQKNSALNSFFIKKLNQMLIELETNVDIKEKIDNWLRETIKNLVEKYHFEIGNMVRASLKKLDDYGLVKQIEEKVWDDLQYIRLNGAVVGGIAGIFIEIIRLIFI